jgi:hypothetical protein
MDGRNSTSQEIFVRLYPQICRERSFLSRDRKLQKGNVGRRISETAVGSFNTVPKVEPFVLETSLTLDASEVGGIVAGRAAQELAHRAQLQTEGRPGESSRQN